MVLANTPRSLLTVLASQNTWEYRMSGTDAPITFANVLHTDSKKTNKNRKKASGVNEEVAKNQSFYGQVEG